MSARTVDTVRNDMNNEMHFLKELEDALQVLHDLGYANPDQSSLEEWDKYVDLSRKVMAQRTKVYHLNKELTGFIR